MKRKILATLIVAFLIIPLVGCGDSKEEGPGLADEEVNHAEESQVSIPEGIDLQTRQMGEFAGMDLNGQPADTSFIADKDYTLVNVWGTFCGACIQSMPDLEAMAEDLAKQDIAVIGIVIDAQGEDESVKQVMGKAKGIVADLEGKIPSYAPSQDFLAGIGSEITAVPSQFLINAKGEVVSSLYLGGAPLETWEEIVKGIK